MTTYPRLVRLSVSAFALMSFLTACRTPALRVVRVVPFAITEENLRSPDLSLPAIASAPLGTPIALAGSGFSPVASANVLVVGSTTLQAWLSSDRYAVFYLFGRPEEDVRRMTFRAAGREVEIPFALDASVPEVDDPEAALAAFTKALEDCVLAPEVREFVETQVPQVLGEFNALVQLVQDYMTVLAGASAAGRERAAVLAEQSRYAATFGDHGFGDGGAEELDAALFGADAFAAKVGATAAVTAAVIGALATTASDDPPSVDFVTVPGRTEVEEGFTSTFECQAEDDTTFSVNESGLASVTPFLNAGEGTLAPPSGAQQTATNDPFTVTITFIPRVTGRSRPGNISCRATDANGNIGFGSADFAILEGVAPRITNLTVEGPDSTRKQIGVPFAVTVAATDEEIAAGAGVPSGIDAYMAFEALQTRLAGPERTDVTPGEFPGPPEAEPGPRVDSETLAFECTELGAATGTVSVFDTARNAISTRFDLTCVISLAQHRPRLNDLPDGELLGGFEVGIDDPQGEPTEFTASFEAPEGGGVAQEGGVVFVAEGSGVDIVLAAAATAPLAGRVAAVSAIVDPALCGGDSVYRVRVSDGPSAMNDTARGETVAHLEAQGIATVRIEAVTGQLCLEEIGLDLAES